MTHADAPGVPRALRLMGLPLHGVGVEEVHAFIARVIHGRRKALVLNLNIHCANLAFRHPWLRGFLEEAELVFCDGDGVRWGVRLLGHRPPPKITYDRWIWQLAAFCRKENFSLFLLGARPGVAAQAARRLEAANPGLRILGTQSGYFIKAGEENEKIVAKINALRPDILVVGFGMPLQEKWLSENWRKIDARIFLTGGAALDYAAGRLKRAPAWMLRCQMEWLFRLCQEPRRLFGRYAVGIPVFFSRVLREKWKRR